MEVEVTAASLKMLPLPCDWFFTILTLVLRVCSLNPALHSLTLPVFVLRHLEILKEYRSISYVQGMDS